MFESFGEFNSYKEINELVENLLNEGDILNIYAVCKENGIDPAFADMYLNGDVLEICDQYTAAIGKIEVEAAQMGLSGIMGDWVEYLKVQVMENDLLAHQVRRKGKYLEGMLAELLKWSFAHQKQIDQKILRAAGISAGKVTLGIPGMAQAKKIILNYYMGA